jgi:hypothetical protein
MVKIILSKCKCKTLQNYFNALQVLQKDLKYILNSKNVTSKLKI